MLENDTTWLEEIMREAFLTISWLKDTEAGGIAEASVEPAPDHQVSEHIDLVAT